MFDWLAATPDNVFHHGRVWTLVTSPLLEIDFLSLLLSLFMLWMFVPTLERFWGTTRFYRFVAVTSIAGTVAGTLVGFALGREVPIVGLSPFVYASVVAFGVVYARQPVQFFGVLPLSGRQMMYEIHRISGAVRRPAGPVGEGWRVCGGDDRGGDHDVEALEPVARAQALADRTCPRTALGDRRRRTFARRRHRARSPTDQRFINWRRL